jgi:diguanylate cyclase (GGDEF)-like protein
MQSTTKFEELRATGRLPSPKGVAAAVLRLTQRDDVTCADLARLVKSDPAFAGRLIKAANSVHAAGHRPMVAVGDAIMLLGIPAARQLALGFSLVAAYRSGACKAFDYDAFWSRSLLTAIAMQMLTKCTRAAPPEETFTSGLLSRVGCLALATLYPVEYGKVMEAVNAAPELELALLEQQSLALDHCALTAAMLHDWGVPKTYIDSVRHHENPAVAQYADGSREYLLAHSLHLASALATVCTAPESARAGMLGPLYLLGTRIGIATEALNEIADQVVVEWRDWGTLLAVPTREVPQFADIGGNAAAAPTAAGADTQGGKSKGLRLLVASGDRRLVAELKRQLQAMGHQVHTTGNGRDALELALDANPQMVIADCAMPGLDGIALTRALRETLFGRSLYILVLTGIDDDEKLREAFDAGADDFVGKPARPRVLEARLRAGRRVIELQREIEQDREEIRHFAAELAVTNRRLQQAALVDPLTEFPNRRYAMERLDQEWAHASRGDRPLACMMIDVDSFKHVNDRYGHEAGDAVLQKTAEVLKRTARAHDVICRIGGDEFLVICPDTDVGAALQCGERLCSAVAATVVEYGNQRFKGSISVGVAARDSAMPDPKAMIRAADHAMYRSKGEGRGRASVHFQAAAKHAMDPLRAV